MIFAHVLRQFTNTTGEVVVLALDVELPALPMIGAHLALMGVDRPLAIVDIVMRPNTLALGRVQPDVDVWLEVEPGAAEGPARTVAWRAAAP